MIKRGTTEPPLTRDDIRRTIESGDGALTMLNDHELQWKGSYAGSEYLIHIAPDSETLSVSNFNCEDDDFIEFLGMLRHWAQVLGARLITDGRDISN